ncbi:response regulator transcription factor [Formosa algae]|uniref:DNA-binding response OmpR family regulator n=1 Tax=Formosa algae TaxID=225843 RepID=A0A9X1CCA7_9FLAO|nr:response regulator transcription factor [Formosa algae]MBP1840917.1 DNA-binding response OmpR family regulator [Formosa algae]MDQ0336186.1 DNA-binding response OmpR family regulator [Formosa algae]OEI79960.1 DNA-binding response regulator [Formosa algae]PNW28299.1 DNA-binding response regulator [Formosa algae]
MIQNILIVEDEYNVATFVKKGLEEVGYNAFIAYDSETCFELILQENIDLILLDVILPGMNGFDIAAKIKDLGFASTPIIFLSALGSTDNIVKGLDTGADDYLTKPFKFKELLARIRAVARRKNIKTPNKAILKIADLELNNDTKIVKRNAIEIKLTSTEFRLLEYLLKNKNKVLSRIDILEHVWDINFNMGTNVVDVYVNYLRNKIDKKFTPKLIQTVVGMGYILKDAVDEN